MGENRRKIVRLQQRKGSGIPTGIAVTDNCVIAPIEIDGRLFELPQVIKIAGIADDDFINGADGV
jgi:hypothetical protein